MGLSIAKRMAPGYHVILADFSEQILNHAYDELANAGHIVEIVQVDVSDFSSMQKLAEHTAAQGAVLKVVYTAGVSGATTQSVERLYRINLLGAAHAIDLFEPVIASGGSFVGISSMAAHVYPVPAELDKIFATVPTGQILENPAINFQKDNLGTAYSISKHALIVRAKAATARYGARGVRINTISPGTIWSPMSRSELEKPNGAIVQAIIDETPVGRVGTSDDIAQLVDFLSGPTASFISGSDVVIDGGALSTGFFEKLMLEAHGRAT